MCGLLSSRAGSADLPCSLGRAGGASRARDEQTSVLLGRAGLRRKHPPVDELLGQLTWGHVVDDRERTQVLGPDGQDLAVVVAALALDGGGVASQGAHLLRRELLQPLQVDNDLR